MRFLIFAVVVALAAAYIFNELQKDDVTASGLFATFKEKAAEVIDSANQKINEIDKEKLKQDTLNAMTNSAEKVKNIMEAVKNRDFSNVYIPEIDLTCTAAKGIVKNMKNGETVENGAFANLINELKKSGLTDSDIDMYIDEVFCKSN